MGIIDIVLLVCFIPAIVSGISKGFVQQVISLASILIGAWLAFHFSSVVSAWLSNYVTLDPKVLNIIAFAAIVIIAVLLLYWLGELITKALKAVTLGWFNRLLGIIFAIFKTALILGLLIMVFEGINDKFHLISDAKIADAQVYNYIRDFAEKVFPYLKSFVTGVPNE